MRPSVAVVVAAHDQPSRAAVGASRSFLAYVDACVVKKRISVGVEVIVGVIAGVENGGAG